MCVSQNDGPHEDTQKTLNSVKRRKKSKKQKPNNLLSMDLKLYNSTKHKKNSNK